MRFPFPFLFLSLTISFQPISFSFHPPIIPYRSYPLSTNNSIFPLHILPLIISPFSIQLFPSKPLFPFHHYPPLLSSITTHFFLISPSCYSDNIDFLATGAILQPPYPHHQIADVALKLNYTLQFFI